MVLEHYLKAARDLNIDLVKAYEDMAKQALVKEELTKEERKKTRKRMK